MRLIDCDHCDCDRIRQREKRIGQQTLRRRIEQPDLAAAHRIERIEIRALVKIAVQACRRKPGVLQCRDLILHQRDQRGNHDRNAGHQHGRHLIADGFSRAGRHDAEHVPAGEDLPDQRLLSVAETVVSEIFLEYGLRRHRQQNFLFLHNKIACISTVQAILASDFIPFRAALPMFPSGSIRTQKAYNPRKTAEYSVHPLR